MAASDIVTYSQPNIYGVHFKCSRRTANHLDYTRQELAKEGKTLRIIQGCYNTTVAISAGTHDYDAVLDVQIPELSWPDAQTWLRKRGWAAWERTPAQGFSYHIHMVSLPPYKLRFVQRVGQWVPGQVTAYYDHRDGLASNYVDNTWHPKDIRSTIFNNAKWERQKELAKKARHAERRITRIRRLLDSLKNKMHRLRQ